MLDSNQVRANKRYVVDLLEHTDNPAMIDARNQDREKIREERRLLLQVEGQSLVIATILISKAPVFSLATLTSRRSQP